MGMGTNRRRLAAFVAAVTRRRPEVEGEARDLLDDITSRFDVAERMVAQVLSDATEHAAKASALDAELDGLVGAEAGTPQAVLRDELSRRRHDTIDRLHDIKREADDLAREASNTAAAGRVARARKGLGRQG
jgi:hypothetical protein